MKNISIWFGAVSLAALAHSPALAADDASAGSTGQQVEDIVVTGQKVRADLQKSPLSITAVSGAALDAQNVSSVKNLDAIAPGLVVNSTPAHPLSVTIRGAGYPGVQNNSAQPGVSYNQNGVYISNPVSLNANFLDVEQVEVIRGPQGTVLGQNSDGGALNITTTRPKLGEISGNGDVSYGTFRYDRVRAALNIPVGDKIAVRAAFQQQKHDGFAEATQVPGHPNYRLGNEDSLNGRLDILFKPTDRFSLELWAEFYRNNAHGDAFKNILDPNPDPRRLTQDFPSKIEQRSRIAAARATYDLGFATVDAIGSYQYGRLDATDGVDRLDFTNAVRIFGVHDVDTINGKSGHSFTQEVDLISKPGGRFQWIIGAFSVQQKYHQTFLEYHYTNRNAVLPASLSDPAAVFSTGALAFEYDEFDKLVSSSIYAQGTYDFTDELRVTMGVRGTDNDHHGTPSTFFAPRLDLRAKSKTLTGKAVVEYDVAPRNTVYSSFSSGVKPGGTNLVVGNQIKSVFPVERNNALELGSKNEFFDRRLRLNVAGYYNFYRNYQINSEDPIPFNGGLTPLKDVRVYGLEAEVTALLPYNFRIDATAASMAGKVKSSEQLLDPVLAGAIDVSQGGPFQGNDLALRNAAFFAVSSNVKGKTPPNLPGFSTSIALGHEFEFSNGSSFISQIKATYRGKYWFRVYNNPLADRTPAMKQVDLDVKYRFAGDRLYFGLTVSNLLDKDYINTRNADNYGVGAISNYYIPPRQIIGRIGYAF